jgi:hypothetical protein
MNLVLALLSSAGFGGLFALVVGYHGGTAAVAGVVTGAVYLAAFLVPARLFGYANSDAAPVVLLQLGRRWVTATLLTLLATFVAASLAPWTRPAQLGMELYVVTLTAVLIFHALAGMYANHVIYLQVTRQYNSNQLLALTVVLVVLLTAVVLYGLAFDLAANREPYFYARDLLLITLAVIGFGWHGFRIAHH